MLRGDIRKLSDLKRIIQKAPITVAQDVAKRAAPALTALTVQAFNSGANVYGDPRPLGVDGRQLTLRKSGATARTMKFTSDGGTIVRCVLGPEYAKYLIGRYGVLPNGALPARWSARLGELVAETTLDGAP
jgi:hypothetical protein